MAREGLPKDAATTRRQPGNVKGHDERVEAADRLALGLPQRGGSSNLVEVAS